MTINSSMILDKLIKLEDVYIQTREAIALNESFTPDNKVFLAPHNELRNVLDHIMRMVIGRDDQDEINKEFKSAYSHLMRAGCDSFEFLCINLIESIHENISKYDSSDISKAWPEYYTCVKPNIIEVQEETAKLRTTENRKFNDEIFSFYLEHSSKLIEYSKKLQLKIPILEDLHKKTKLKSIIGYLIGGIGILIGIIGFLR